jgi:hypothetical protein
LGLFAMFSPSPLNSYASGRSCKKCPRKLEAGSITPRGPQACPPAACPLHPQTSYWVSDTNEMAAIKTFLIIVNSFVP